MKPSLEKREEPAGLVFHVKQSRKLSGVLITLAGSVAFFYLFWRGTQSQLEQGFVACIILMVLARQVVSAWRGADVYLRVTNFDLISKGLSPSDYKPSTISRADIYDLQYRKAQHGGGEFPDLPEGLYAEYRQDVPWEASACILPHVGREQTEKIIQAISYRFPDTGTLASRPSKASVLTSLDLNRPADR
jgi:hypothetical protein